MINEEETMKNKEIARKFYELIAARKYDEAAKLCSDDFVYYPQVSTRLNGVDKFIDLEKSNMEPAGDFNGRVEAFERKLLREALRDSGGNVAAAARALNLTIRVIHYKLRGLGIDPAEFKV